MRSRVEDAPALPEGFEWADWEITPKLARTILDRIPADSYHWRDIERKAPNAVGVYTRLMSQGRWRDETAELGFYEHPIRFDAEGNITHGVMRLLACRDSGRPFRAAVQCPTGFFAELVGS